MILKTIYRSLLIIISTVTVITLFISSNYMTGVYVANQVCQPITARVTLTTYSSVPNQTDSTPTIGAFNTKVGFGSVAVSNDLLEMGFTPFSKIWIDGHGEFVIRDKTSKNIENTIDIWTPKGGKHFKEKNVLVVRYCSGMLNSWFLDMRTGIGKLLFNKPSS